MDLTRFLSNRKPAASDSGAPAKMIVGLGNPGPEYARNRHNIGFQVVDLFAGRHALTLDKFQKRARLGIGTVKLPGGNVKVLLAKPMTYMNLSGEAVGALAAFYKIVPADILVISDDLDLPPGKLRLRADGSAGGQKGVKSIAQHLHTEIFPRLRVGIGRPGGQGSSAPPGMDPAAYVLQNFTAAEETEMAFLRAAIEQSQQNVTSEACVQLYKGAAQVTGRRSPVSLYSESTVTFGDSETEYRQSDATGFMRIQGQRLRPERRGPSSWRPRSQLTASASPVLNVQSLEPPEVPNVRRHEHELVDSRDRRDLPIGRGRRAPTPLQPNSFLRVPRGRLLVIGKDGQCGSDHLFEIGLDRPPLSRRRKAGGPVEELMPDDGTGSQLSIVFFDPGQDPLVGP